MTVIVEDTVTLQPIQPASGLLACPEQDIILNCTIVRVSDIQGVLQPALTWQYRGDSIVYNSALVSSDFYTAVFYAVNLTVMSTVTINSVPLSYNNSTINCLSPATTIHSETITIAGSNITYFSTN